ncbi:MAG: hypothetical protein ACJ8DI_03200 [Ktedonobacteraceae bacterium]
MRTPLTWRKEILLEVYTATLISQTLKVAPSPYCGRRDAGYSQAA